MIPALPISLNHCEEGISSRQAEKAQPADKNQLIPHCLSKCNSSRSSSRKPPRSSSLVHQFLTTHKHPCVCHPSAQAHSRECGFKTRISVRIWVVNTRTGLNTVPRPYWAFNGKMELKRGMETTGVPSPPPTGNRKLFGIWTKECLLSYWMSPKFKTSEAQGTLLDTL